MTKAIILGAMTAFIGTKSVLAVTMTRGEYNEYRGWQLPADEVDLKDEQGFLVEYLDGGRSNHDNHKGYISWSPKDVFERSYKPPKLNSNLTFGEALEYLKKGEKLARSGWNGKGQYLVANPQPVITDASKIWNRHNRKHAENLGGEITVSPYITLKNAQDQLVMGWIPSTGDLFAEDWAVIE